MDGGDGVGVLRAGSCWNRVRVQIAEGGGYLGWEEDGNGVALRYFKLLSGIGLGKRRGRGGIGGGGCRF